MNISLSLPAREVFHQERGRKGIRDFFIGQLRRESDPWRSATAQEVAGLHDVFTFVNETRARFGIDTPAQLHELRVHISSRSHTGDRALGRGSAVLRAISIYSDVLNAALSGDAKLAIDARGTLVHEQVHAAGHVRLSFRRNCVGDRYFFRQNCGLSFCPGEDRFQALEEYIASRMQFLYYASKGFPEREQSHRMTMPCRTLLRPLEDAMRAACPHLEFDRTSHNGVERLEFSLPIVSNDLRLAEYGIIRAAVYRMAERMFPSIPTEEARDKLDRLMLRAQTLGEYGELFRPMAATLGAKALRTVGLLSVVHESAYAFVILAGLGEAMRHSGAEYERRIDLLESAAALQARAAKSERRARMIM